MWRVPCHSYRLPVGMMTRRTLQFAGLTTGPDHVMHNEPDNGCEQCWHTVCVCVCCVCVCVCVCAHVRMHVCMRACMRVCVCVCVWTDIGEVC